MALGVKNSRPPCYSIVAFGLRRCPWSIILKAKIFGKKVILPSVCVMEGERLVDEITFDFPKSYNNTDLASLTPFANLMRSDGSTDKIQLSATVGEYIAVTLPVNASVTAVPGELSVQISFESDGGEIVFITEKFTLNINCSVNAYKDLTDREPSAIYSLRMQMIAYVNRMQQLVDEFNDKLNNYDGSTSGSGGGGVAYDEENKLPASYIDGLANVATSGSYTDLSNKPNLGIYATQTSVTQGDDAVKLLTQPLFIKYISFEDTNEVILALCNENKAVMAEFVAAGKFVRPTYLWDVANETYYPLVMATISGAQYELYFQKNSTLYIAIYDGEQDSYGFSE